MVNRSGSFWLALLDLANRKHINSTCLWNGYLAWKLPTRGKVADHGQFEISKQDVLEPEGGWPELSCGEKKLLDDLSDNYNGHPVCTPGSFMDFSSRRFESEVDFSGLTFVCAKFSSIHSKKGFFSPMPDFLVAHSLNSVTSEKM